MGAPKAEVVVASAMQIRAQVHLGELTPEDVVVELHMGRVDPQGEIIDAVAVPMSCGGRVGEGLYDYESNTSLAQSGLHGFTICVRPTHPDLTVPFVPGLIRWAGSECGKQIAVHAS